MVAPVTPKQRHVSEARFADRHRSGVGRSSNRDDRSLGRTHRVSRADVARVESVRVVARDPDDPRPLWAERDRSHCSEQW